MNKLNLSLSALKQEDFNKLKKWKEEEYSKIRSDLGLILDIRGPKNQSKRSSLELNKKLSQQLERVEKELNVLKKERLEKKLVKIEHGYRTVNQSHRKFISY